MRRLLDPGLTLSSDPSPDPSRQRRSRLGAILAGLGGTAGLVLLVIGVRFVLWPEAATRTFGLAGKPPAAALNAIIGLRDIWLAGRALAFAALREWRALALWLLLGAAVCLGDALIVAAHGPPHAGPAALAFHGASGVFCAGLGWRCWRLAARLDR